MGNNTWTKALNITRNDTANNKSSSFKRRPPNWASRSAWQTVEVSGEEMSRENSPLSMLYNHAGKPSPAFSGFAIGVEMQPFKRSRSFSHLFRKTALFLISVFASFGQSPTSPSDLMRQVVHALELKDERTLKNLAITKSECKRFVWPTLSRTLPKLGINADAFYSMSVKESEIGLASTVRALGGRKLEVLEEIGRAS